MGIARRRPKRRITIDSLLKKLRLVDEPEPDVVVAIRLRATEDGGWDVKWDGVHWLIFDEGHEPPPDCLPPGVPEQIVKIFAYQTAKSTGGDFMATLGASFGKAAVDKIANALPHIRRKE